MKFWIKIGLLSGVTYVACNVSLLLQDRCDRRQMVAEVEAATRVSFREVQAGGCSQESLAKLWSAQHRLASADARWERDASRLLLLDY
jgi:hypothetical protein